MFAKIARPFFDRGDDRGEVVVGEHHVGGLFRHVRPGDAHGDADVGLLQRRRVVHAVAGHRHDRARAPQRVDDAQLVFGVDARVDGHLGDRARPCLVRQLLELRAGDGAAVLGDAELLGDHRGRARVIAGNHQRADAGAFGPGHGVLRLVARWVDHADQPGEHEVLFDALVRAGGVLREGVGRQPEAGDAERAQRLAGERLVHLQNLRATRGRQRSPVVAHHLEAAPRQQHVGRALREHDPARAAAPCRGGSCSSACARRRTGTSPTRGSRSSSASG